MKPYKILTLITALLTIGITQTAWAVTGPGYSITQMAGASPDECFGGIGAPYQPMTPSGCATGRTPKTNQAYVWGLTETDQDLWFGTAANVNCLVEGGYLNRTTPYQTSAWVCEFGSSGFRAMYAPTIPATLGDWRPSQIYYKPKNGGALVNAGITMDGASQTRLSQTLGLRSAGNLNGIVILAGPALNPAFGLSVFAFNAQSHQFLGSTSLPGYNNIRKWITANGSLYTTVGLTNGTGALLKWVGTAQNPFLMTTVATLPSEGAELIEHQGHIFVATWPNITVSPPTYAGVFASPTLPAQGGLPPSSAPMTQIWDARNYEPEPIIAATYGGGAMASFDGKLTWGTMHVPGVATVLQIRAYQSYYDSLDSQTKSLEEFVAAIATQRAITIFSASGITQAQPVPTQIALLYGERYLPVFDPSTHRWQLAPNNAGATPTLGPSGFGNPFNNYTWTMAIAQQGLYVGTMDWLYLLEQGLKSGSLGVPTPISASELDSWLAQIQTLYPEYAQLMSTRKETVNAIRRGLGGQASTILSPGADLVRFETLSQPAQMVSNDGLGNYLNYGIRAMVGKADQLYTGTANSMNLMTQGPLYGGWELKNVIRSAIPTEIPSLDEWKALALALLLGGLMMTYKTARTRKIH